MFVTFPLLIIESLITVIWLIPGVLGWYLNDFPLSIYILLSLLVWVT